MHAWDSYTYALIKIGVCTQYVMPNNIIAYLHFTYLLEHSPILLAVRVAAE